ncbi:MAG: hypothetical protein AAGI07_10755 [Bacteroidota bacterium]
MKPSPLELHGDSVSFVASVQVPSNVLKPKVMYELDVYYDTETADPVLLGKMEYDGAQLAENPSPTVEKYFGFIYDEQYKEGQVQFKGRAFKKTKPEKFKESEFYTIDDLGKGVITTSQLTKAPYAANYIPHGYDNSEKYEPQNVDFYFLQGRSNLRYSERRGEMGKMLDGYVQENLPTRRVNITGMHSPEGSSDVNSKLANERASVVEEFYKSLAGKYDYESTMDSIEFVQKPVVEDWNAFKEAVTASDRISDAQKSEVMDIVNGSGDFVSKELKLQTLSFYRVLYREIYPPLRAGKAEILKIKIEPTDAEIMVMSQKAGNGEEVDGLNAKMVAFAASMSPSLQEKEKMYLAAIKMDDSYSSYNNLGATYMQMAMQANSESDKMSFVEKAISNFKLSVQKQQSAEATVNLASAQLLSGDVAAAKSTLSGASGSGEIGQSISALKGYFAITTADYVSAISELERAGNDPVSIYNKALAMLLKASKEMDDDYTKVKSAFGDAVSADAQNAHAYYCAAITAARMDNSSDVTSMLQKAISIDSSLKERAVKDLEFINVQDAVTAATR